MKAFAKSRFLGLLLLLSGAVLGLWAFWWEPSALVVSNYEIEKPRWPAELDGLKIVVLADLHVGSPWNDVERLNQVVEAANAEAPDLFLLTGDYLISDVVGGTYVGPENIAPVLGKLEAPLGVYAVLGNHDWWEDARGVRREFGAVGIKLLENEARIIVWKDREINLFGLGDDFSGHDDLAALEVASRGDQPFLAFTHSPDVFPDIPPRDMLLVAGHTHGGQVDLPFLGRLIVPSKYGERYAIGHVSENGNDLLVSPGVGTSIIPVRFRVPPEISVLTIKIKKTY